MHSGADFVLLTELCPQPVAFDDREPRELEPCSRPLPRPGPEPRERPGARPRFGAER